MWNKGEPLKFSTKWNPFTNSIPWATFTSHPLLWHKGITFFFFFLGVKITICHVCRWRRRAFENVRCGQFCFTFRQNGTTSSTNIDVSHST